MAFDVFVQLSGIKGESSDGKYAGWIEALDYGMGISQNISRSPSSVGGACAGRADFSEFTFRKALDIASPGIALACAAGTHIETIIIAVCRSGKERGGFMEYQLTRCMISEVLTIGGGQFPSETISVSFAEIMWCYTQQKRRGGGAAGNIAAGWSLEANHKV